MATDEIKILINADAKGAQKSIDGINKDLKKTETQAAGLKTAYLAVAGILSSVVVKGFQATIKAADKFQEANSKFIKTFAGVGSAANDLRKELVKNYGLSTTAATELLSSTGDLLSGFGFTGEAALKLSGDVNKLAVDLASFSNAQGGSAAVSQALTKALLGEREGLKTYGIAIQEADVQAALLEKGFQNLTGEALRQAKAQVTLELAVRQSKNAVGDFARTADSNTNILRRSRAIADDFVLALGQRLRKEVGESKDLLDGFLSLNDEFNILGRTIAAIVLAFNLVKSTITLTTIPLRTLALSFQTVFLLVGDLFDYVRERFSFLNTAISAATGVFNNVKNAVVGLFNDVKKEGDKLSDIIPEGKIKDRLATLKDGLLAIGSDVGNSYQDIFNSLIELFNGTTSAAVEGTNIVSEALNNIAIQQEENTVAEIKNIEDVRQQRRDAANEALSLAQGFATAINGLSAASTANQIANIEQAAEAGAISQEAAETRIKAAKKKQARADKATAIFNAALSGAQAILNVISRWAWNPPVMGPLIGATSVLTGLQIGAIAATPIPAFAKGGIMPYDGMAMVGEQGPELVNLPAGAQVVNNTETNRILNNDNKQITVQVNGINDPLEFANRLKRQYGVNII